MKIRAVILASAAVFAVAATADAADLSVAEPVDYVRVCDGFGVGFWVIPGTDTCLKVGGYVQVDTLFHDTTYVGGGHSAGWQIVTEASAQFSAKSMTEYGELAAYAEFRAQSNNANWFEWDTGKRLAYLDSAWLRLGGLLAGRAESLYDYAGGFTFDGSDLDSDASADQIRLTWALGGFGLAVGIEDPRDRFGSDLPDEYSVPNIVGAITATQANWDGKLSAAYGETYYVGGFGVQASATFKIDSIAPGDRLRVKGAWAQSEVASFADSSAYNYSGSSVWSALASFQHFWSSQLSSAVTLGYSKAVDDPYEGDIDKYQVSGNLVWSPVSGFSAGAEVGYSASRNDYGKEDGWAGKVRVIRSW